MKFNLIYILFILFSTQESLSGSDLINPYFESDTVKVDTIYIPSEPRYYMSESYSDLRMEPNNCFKYKHMRGSGVALAIAGTTLTIIGLVLVTEDDPSNIGYFLDGEVPLTIGALLLGGSIPLFVVGNYKVNKYCKNKTLEVLNIGVQKSGIGIAYTF